MKLFSKMIPEQQPTTNSMYMEILCTWLAHLIFKTSGMTSRYPSAKQHTPRDIKTQTPF